VALVVPRHPFLVGDRGFRFPERRADEHVSSVDPHRIDRGASARAAIRSSRDQVELPAVAVAGDGSFLRRRVGQRQAHVRARVAHREQPLADAEHGDAHTAHDDHATATLAEPVQAADRDPVRHQSNWM